MDAMLFLNCELTHIHSRGKKAKLPPFVELVRPQGYTWADCLGVFVLHRSDIWCGTGEREWVTEKRVQFSVRPQTKRRGQSCSRVGE